MSSPDARDEAVWLSDRESDVALYGQLFRKLGRSPDLTELVMYYLEFGARVQLMDDLPVVLWQKGGRFYD